MPNTEPLFRADPYLAEAQAKVHSINDRGGVILDRTVFFATGGGQPGDSGRLGASDGDISIATTVYGEIPGEIVHVPSEGAPLPEPGQTVRAAINWERRYKHMRIHTALHLLSVVLPYPVTGGSISDIGGRLDFDLDGNLPDKSDLEDLLNALVAADHAVSEEWISDDALLAKPDLVKTMKVKPPMGTGKVRLVRIGDIDLQPCGGTHVRATS